MAKRTSYGATWWGQRWIAALEQLGWASRLQRGRSYARPGHVLALEVKPGKVTARVAGSRPQPYRVIPAPWRVRAYQRRCRRRQPGPDLAEWAPISCGA